MSSAWLLPVLLALPLCGALALVVLPAAIGDRLARPLGAAVTGLTLAVALAGGVAADWGTRDGFALVLQRSWVPSLGLAFRLGVDGISLPLVLLSAGLCFLCALYSLRVLPEAGRPRAFVGLLLLLEVGLLGTFLALDLLLFFVFFEVVLVPMWFLIAVWGDGARTAAANRFILFTLLGSVVMLLGILLVGLRAGTFDLVVLLAGRGPGLPHGVQVLAFLALLVGFGVKAPMWPLHTWLPAAHTAAPTVGSVLLAGVLLKMGTYGLVRIGVGVVPAGAAALAPWLAVLAVVGIVYGSLACLAQSDLKRLIAYSSVGHMGFVLLGISTLTPAGINGALYANIAHGIITGLLFFLVGAVKDRHHTALLGELGGGLYARAPRLGGLLAFAAVASLGLPGLAGFWGEMLALLGAFDPGAGLDPALYRVLMAVAGLGTVLTAAYLLLAVRRVAQGVSLDRWREAVLLGDATRHELAVWSPLVAATLVLGLWPGPLLAVTDSAVRSLLGAG